MYLLLSVRWQPLSQAYYNLWSAKEQLQVQVRKRLSLTVFKATVKQWQKTSLCSLTNSEDFINKFSVLKHLILWLCKSEVMNNVLSEDKIKNIVSFFTMCDKSQNSLCVLRDYIWSVQHDLHILLDSDTSTTFVSKELLSKLLLKYVWSIALKIVKFSNRSHNQVS